MQNSTTTSAQIIDAQNNIASIDTSSQQLKVQEPTVQDILQQQITLLQNMSDYLDNLIQQRTSGAASLSVAIPQDNIVNINNQDTVVNGITTQQTTSIINPISGSYVDIELNGHAVVTVQQYTSPINQYFNNAVQATIDGTSWFSAPCISGVGQNLLSNIETSIFYVLCSGFKKLRYWCTVSNRAIYVTMRASYAMPINVLMAQLSYISGTTTSSYASTLITPQVLSTAGTPNTLGVLVNTTAYRLNNPILIGSTIGNVLYGAITYNPNDFPVYLVFWDSTDQPGLFNVSDQGIENATVIPSGGHMIIPNLSGIFNATNYIYMAVSMTDNSYVPVPLGVDVVIFSQG